MAELILKLKDREIKRINISKVETTMGRDPDCDLFIDNIGISREHCKIIYRGGHFFLRDNGSSNGTFLNNSKIMQESQLNDQDEVQLGKYRVIFSAAGGMPEHLLGASDEDLGSKKVRSVFGTVQFSPDEIQNLLTASGDDQQLAPIAEQFGQGSSNSSSGRESLSKQAQLNVILGVVVAILVVLLVVVLLQR